MVGKEGVRWTVTVLQTFFYSDSLNYSPFGFGLFAAGIYGNSKLTLEDLGGYSDQTNVSSSFKGRGVFGSKINPTTSEENFYSVGGFLTSEQTFFMDVSRTWGYAVDNDWAGMWEGTKGLAKDLVKDW